MYLSSIDEVNSVDIDDNSQIRQGTTSPITSNPSQSSPPSCPTLLVIDDNSNSDDTPLIISDIPINSMVSSAQIASSSPLSTLEPPQGISEQQRRRNSSIAKLLGGQPLTNQQYEEINQQILDDQSSQSVTNNSDNGTDTGIQRSRSSITRTLLMNPERNDNTLPTTTTTTKTKARPSSPEFSKDFEYLIRRELDIEHAPSTLNRNSSTPSIFQNLSSARNSPTHTQSPSQSKLKRKRVNPKQQPVSTPTINKSLNNPPFTIPDPFELDHPPSSLNSAPVSRSHHHQNDLYRFDISHPHSRHHHHHHHQQNQQQQQQQQQQYSLPMNSSTPNSAPFIFHQINLNSPNYAQFKIHHDRVPTIPCSPASSLSSSSSSSSSTSSCNCCRYPATPELASSTSVSSLSPNPSSPSIIPHQTIAPSSRKTKAIHNRPDIYEIPMQRSYSATSNSSIASLSSPPLSSGHSIPLKKRLLHAYKNEQRPSSTL